MTKHPGKKIFDHSEITAAIDTEMDALLAAEKAKTTSAKPAPPPRPAPGPRPSPARTPVAKPVSPEEEHKMTRDFAEMISVRVPPYKDQHPLWAKTEAEGVEKFKQVTREVWNDFVTHGEARRDGDKIWLVAQSDLDARTALGL